MCPCVGAKTLSGVVCENRAIVISCYSHLHTVTETVDSYPCKCDDVLPVTNKLASATVQLVWPLQLLLPCVSEQCDSGMFGLTRVCVHGHVHNRECKLAAHTVYTTPTPTQLSNVQQSITAKQATGKLPVNFHLTPLPLPLLPPHCSFQNSN